METVWFETFVCMGECRGDNRMNRFTCTPPESTWPWVSHSGPAGGITRYQKPAMDAVRGASHIYFNNAVPTTNAPVPNQHVVGQF